MQWEASIKVSESGTKMSGLAFLWSFHMLLLIRRFLPTAYKASGRLWKWKRTSELRHEEAALLALLSLSFGDCPSRCFSQAPPGATLEKRSLCFKKRKYWNSWPLLTDRDMWCSGPLSRLSSKTFLMQSKIFQQLIIEKCVKLTKAYLNKDLGYLYKIKAVKAQIYFWQKRKTSNKNGREAINMARRKDFSPRLLTQTRKWRCHAFFKNRVFATGRRYESSKMISCPMF